MAFEAHIISTLDKDINGINFYLVKISDGEQALKAVLGNKSDSSNAVLKKSLNLDEFKEWETLLMSVDGISIPPGSIIRITSSFTNI